MKFPKKLSKERLSLLSPEDRKIYEYEHSGLCPEMKKLQESRKKIVKNDKGEIVPDTCTKCGGNIVLQIHGEPVYICSKCGKYYGTMPFTLHESEESDEEELTFEEVRDFELDNEYTEEEKREIKRMFDEMLFESQFDELYDKELIEEVGLEEYNNIKKQIFEYIMNDPELNALNEAEGHAADWWVDCSWIVKLSAGLLTGLLGIIAWLIMKGKDRLAMAKLKQYMNKLVELTDQGINKKRPWYSFLMPGRKNKQNTGDYNKACFRTIQETAERNMACLYTSTIHDLGFLSPNTSNFRHITSGFQPDEDSGLGKFFQIASFVSEDAEGVYLEGGEQKLVPVHANKEHFQTLKLPALPTNYTMLMSNIDYPTKTNENPNGSLFMKPTEEILQAQGSDIGLTYFNDNVNLNSIVNRQTNKNESLLSTRNSVLTSLLEVENEDGYDKTKASGDLNLLTPDLDPTKVAGKELDQETEMRQKTEVAPFKGNLVDAIDNYVRSSIPVVTKLIRSICGKNASSNVSKFATLVATLNNASEGNMSKYMKKYDSILKDVMDNEYQKDINGYRDFAEECQHLAYLTKVLGNEKACKALGLDNNKKKSFSKRVAEALGNKDTRKSDVDYIIKVSTDGLCNKYDDFVKVVKPYMQSEQDETLQFLYHGQYAVTYLFENEQVKNNQEILSMLSKGMETGFKEVKNRLTEELVSIVESVDPADWQIIENSKTRMTKLKEAADKEITAKIELICRTASGANSDLGDKFKAALSKHPVRAESLKNIWTRYSDDLQDRIESRIRSISGDNGNSNILQTIKQFLTVTYPNLIAIMLYYKQMFYLIKLYTEKYPISTMNKEEIDKQNRGKEKFHLYGQLSNLEIQNEQN